MKNNLLKLLTKDKEIRLYLVDVTDIINQDILDSIKTLTVKQLYKKLIANSSLLRGFLTEPDQRLSIIFRFRPEGCTVHCNLDGNGNFNCMLSSQLCNYTGEISGLVGKGATLSITRGGWSTGMFTGTVELNEPLVDQFFSYFFTKSEQTETIFRTWDTAEGLRGCMIQPLPFAEKANIRNLIRSVDHHEMYLSTGDWDNIAHMVFPNAMIIEQYSLQPECDCSKEMFYGLLMSVDINELKSSILQNKSEELECGICGKRYLFHHDDLMKIVEAKENQ